MGNYIKTKIFYSSYSLPRVFDEGVKLRIKERFDRALPYESLTYGDIINYINQEALSLCSLLKIYIRIQNKLRSSRKELGSFCAQF